MSKNNKKILGIVIIVILILAIVWLVYENIKPQPTSINTTNELPDENKGIDNIINDLFENEVVNEEVNVTTNEIANETVNDDNTENKEENSSTSETVEGTTLSRKEKAIEIAKKYYKEKYGSTDGIYFTCEEVNGDGRYIVRAGSAGTVNNKFLLVNLDTELVTEK